MHHGFHDDSDHDGSLADAGSSLEFRPCPCGGAYKRILVREPLHWYNAGHANRRTSVQLECAVCSTQRAMTEDVIIRK